MLIDELLNDGYDFVFTARLQRVERQSVVFSQYRQMSSSSQLERSTKHRADFILPLTNKEGYELLEGGPITCE